MKAGTNINFFYNENIIGRGMVVANDREEGILVVVVAPFSRPQDRDWYECEKCYYNDQWRLKGSNDLYIEEDKEP